MQVTSFTMEAIRIYLFLRCRLLIYSLFASTYKLWVVLQKKMVKSPYGVRKHASKASLHVRGDSRGAKSGFGSPGNPTDKGRWASSLAVLSDSWAADMCRGVAPSADAERTRGSAPRQTKRWASFGQSKYAAKWRGVMSSQPERASKQAPWSSRYSAILQSEEECSRF